MVLSFLEESSASSHQYSSAIIGPWCQTHWPTLAQKQRLFFLLCLRLLVVVFWGGRVKGKPKGPPPPPPPVLGSPKKHTQMSDACHGWLLFGVPILIQLVDRSEQSFTSPPMMHIIQLRIPHFQLGNHTCSIQIREGES